MSESRPLSEPRPAHELSPAPRSWSTTVDLDGREATGSSTVDWTPAAPEADETRLRPWRRAVGPARFGQARTAARCDEGVPLTVAAWNARTGGGALRAFWRRLLQERTRADGPVAALLQEVYALGAPDVVRTGDPGPDADRWAWAKRIGDRPPGEPRTDVVSFAREEGLSLLYAPSMRNGRGGAEGTPPEDRGNAVVANVPLLAPGAVELPFERQRRVAVTAQLALGPHRIGLCSVHLDNRAPWRRAWRSLGRARLRQMTALLRKLPEGSPPIAFVLGGDLNTWARGRGEAAYALARRRFPRPSAPYSDPRPTHRFEIGGFLRHSDHLLFSVPSEWRAESRRLDDAFGSDHYPLVGTLDLGG